MIRQVATAVPLQDTPAWTQAIFKAEDVPAGSPVFINDPQTIPTEADTKMALKIATNVFGFYQVARILAELSKEVSDEYAQAGNATAVVHRDSRLLCYAVNSMRSNTILRSPDAAL